MNIAIVNDLELEIIILKRYLESVGNFNIIWTANNGSEAIEKNNTNKADLILMNLNMPQMDGLEATKIIMNSNPTPIIIITSSPEISKNKVFLALREGALDVSSVPTFSNNKFFDEAELLKKINTVKKLIKKDLKKEISNVNSDINFKLVLIGASTGGPKAILNILERLPEKLNGSIIIIQHLDKQFSNDLIDWLKKNSGRKLTIPKNGKKIEKEHIYIATGDEHLYINDNFFYFSKEPTHFHYKPSINIFFESIANNINKTGLAVILTGMGNDGTNGIIALKNKGWTIIAQNEETSAVFGMPKSAIESGCVSYIFSIEQISDYISKYFKGQSK